jgi:Mrp family chromosome partitioning ATPase/capsular polysaccharide biosynthesis protein
MSEELTTRPAGEFVRGLRASAWLIALLVVVFGAAGYLYSERQKPEYEASSAISVMDPATAVTGAASTDELPAALAAAEAEKIPDSAVTDRVVQLVGTKLTPSDLEASIATTVDPTSNNVIITATATSPTLAVQIADAYAQADATETNSAERQSFAAQASVLEARLKALRPKVRAAAAAGLAPLLVRDQELAQQATGVQIQQLASTPSAPSSPKTLRNTLLLAVLGFVIGIAVADVRRSRDRRLRTPEEIEAHIEQPLIGHVSDNALGQSGSTANGSNGPLAPADLEGFRILRKNLQLLSNGRQMKLVVITSALPQEGKSTVAAMLSQASAAAGKETLLIECDLRRPVLAKRLALRPAPGLSDYLAGTATPSEVLQLVAGNPLEAPNHADADADADTDADADAAAPADSASLYCITAGSAPRTPELLTSHRFQGFLEDVSDAYDAVFIDATPLLSVADALELVPLADGVIVCVRAEATTREQALAAKNALRRTPDRPTGIVVTGVSASMHAYYGYQQS